jgi:hypothetical protein
MLVFASLAATAQSRLDGIARRLANAPVQEKVYLHLDNTCYYKGDTIWYKSYVVRADDLHYTDMSHILYVELVSPDGLVVERQSVIVSADGHGDGNFALKDSLYSGYYELRAYTRWMLNFCVTEHFYTRKDRDQFYNRQMAQDFFRQYGTIYSRVVPVYERPDSLGDYLQKYIVSRPKTRLDKELKEQLKVNFYPEGGHLVAGTRSTVAFEALSEEGEQIDISGTLEVDDGKTVNISTEHQGRGLFTVDVPESGRMKARFRYHDKDYSFDLPKAEKQGCALHLNATGKELKADITLKTDAPDAQVGVAVLCRGVLKSFQTISGSQQVTFDRDQLPTGVCDLLVIDEDGQPLADRLFFVNHQDIDMQPVSVSGMQLDYQPFDPITLQFQAPVNARHISISVRDGSSDDPTYDTGNIMTDLLLSSDLKGFIAYPDYYFESDDDTHRRHLDLLMMVQGWRRYDYQELTSSEPLRYQPEQVMAVEGAVFKTIAFDEVVQDEVPYWHSGAFGWTPEDSLLREQLSDDFDRWAKGGHGSEVGIILGDEEQINNEIYSRFLGSYEGQNARINKTNYNGDVLGLNTAASKLDNDTASITFAVNHGGLKEEVILNGELVLGNDVATVEMETTNGGYFFFNIPPYYGDGILFLSAHKKDISDRKLERLETRGRLDEEAWPEFYIKRNLFYPVFARKYDYYQCHLPEENAADDAAVGLYDDGERLSSMDRQLNEVKVKARRRRGRHAIDYTKPACAYDTYELYNLATDYGLSFGRFNPRRFPVQISMLLLGNYNSSRFFNVEGRLSDNLQRPYTYYRNFSPDMTAAQANPNRSAFNIFKNIHLNRQNEVHLFTDFELRNEEKPIEQGSIVADVTLDFVLFDDDAKQYTYRDRRIVLHGMYMPDDFYHPDYSRRPLPDQVHDYRRTLYWNPNATLDADGRFTATFYNNGKPTRIKVSTAGVFE